MCFGELILLAEIILLIAGVAAIATGKLPSWVLGGGKYKYEGPGVRWLGLILAFPLPLAILVAFVLGVLMGEEARGVAALFEIVIVPVALIAAILVGRRVRQPADKSSDEETLADGVDVQALIAKKSTASLIYALLGILGPAAFVVCPLAFWRATQALRLIDEHQVGQEYRRAAAAARILAAILFVVGPVLTVVLVIGMVKATS